MVDLNDDRDRRYLKAVNAAARNSGRRPWQWYNRLGEVSYSIGRSGRVAGYADFKVQRLKADGKTWEEISEGPWAELAASLASPFDGKRGLIQRFYALMKIPGDSLLIRVREDNQVIGYHFLSAEEVDQSEIDPILAAGAQRDGIRWVMLPTTMGAEERLVRDVEARDVLGRVWHPSYQWVERPQSTLEALDTECEALDLLTRSILGRIRSRFAMAGMWFFPEELSEANVVGMPGPSGRTDLITYLNKAMTANVTNPERAESAVPIMLRGPGAAGEWIKEFVADRTIDEVDVKLRTELIERILFGMDVQQTAVTGGEEVSHWGSWNASDEERRIAVEPDLEMLDWALTTLVLHKEMQDLGLKDEEIVRYRIAHDLDRAAVRTNAQEDVRQAMDRGVANAEALARRTGLAEDERMEGDELIRHIGMQLKIPRMATWKIEGADALPWDEITPPAVPGPGQTRPGDKQKTGPGVGDPGSPNGAKRSTPKGATPA